KERGFIPSTLEKLVTDRIELKEKMGELEEDSREYQSIYNRQWALKIIANSFYGMLGYPRARWYSKECAESVTSFGRFYIKNTIEQAEEEGFHVVYGDSVDYSREIVVKDSEGKIKFVAIGDFVENEDDPQSFKTLAYDESQNEVEFTKIKKAISHPYEGKLLKFSTDRGGTVVTPQHSVYKYERGKPVLSDARDLKSGDKLISLTKVPQPRAKYEIGNSIDVASLDFNDNSLRAYKNNWRLFSDGGECTRLGKNMSLHLLTVEAVISTRELLSTKQEKSTSTLVVRTPKSKKYPATGSFRKNSLGLSAITALSVLHPWKKTEDCFLKTKKRTN
ncbi:hypothetical protein AKJ41_04435, partial [candidate division MSBL1 archaeon SCGC-AAA259O05]